MAWIRYGDSGELGKVLDSLDDSFGSIILFSGQTKTSASFIENDSDSLYGSPTLIGSNQLSVVDSENESHIIFSFIASSVGAAQDVEVEDTGPVQVWVA